MIDRQDELSFYMRQLERNGADIRKYAQDHYTDHGQHIVNNMINSIFPDCHDLTKKYIQSGYVLDEEWEEAILNYLQDDRINVLSNELIFILFSIKMPVEDFLQSNLPKSYLAKLLPIKNS
jgi:hypothetical protein